MYKDHYCIVALYAGGKDNRHDTSIRIPVLAIAYIRMHGCADWICNYNRVQFSNPLVTSQRARIGFGAARERARSRQSRSEAIGTLMTGITSWKILHLFSLSLVLSFISVSFRSRCFTYRRDEYRWAGTSIVHSCVALPFRLRLRFVGVMSRCIGRI